MQRFPCWTTTAHPAELQRLLVQEAAHRLVVGQRARHLLVQHLPDTAQHAHVLLRRLDTQSRRRALIQADGDVFMTYPRCQSDTPASNTTKLVEFFRTTPWRPCKAKSPGMSVFRGFYLQMKKRID